jgi:hypothetical protein
MNTERKHFSENLDQVRKRMAEAARAAGRDPATIQLLPVTKTRPGEVLAWVREEGLPAVGENRVQEALEKRGDPADRHGLRWELIGHLQSNKAGAAVTHFDRIQSVDSLRLARRLDRLAAAEGRVLPVLLQVNTGEDPRKYGWSPEGLRADQEALLALGALRIEGLMTIGPLAGGREAARPAFARLRQLAGELRGETGLPLPELSMGMSGDLEEAVAEGSTLVRIGSDLFGARDP